MASKEISTSFRFMFELGESFEAMKREEKGRKLEKFFSNRTFADLYMLDENMAIDYITKKTEKIVEYLSYHGDYVSDHSINKEEIKIVKEIIIESLICSFRTWEADSKKYGNLTYGPKMFNSDILSRYDTYETPNDYDINEGFDYIKNVKNFNKLMSDSGQ